MSDEIDYEKVIQKQPKGFVLNVFCYSHCKRTEKGTQDGEKRKGGREREERFFKPQLLYSFRLIDKARTS